MRIPFRQPVLLLHIPHFLSARKSYHPRLRYAMVRWFVLPVSHWVVNISLATNPSSGSRTIWRKGDKQAKQEGHIQFIGVYQFLEFCFHNDFAQHAMITLNHVKVMVPRMSNKLRGV